MKNKKFTYYVLVPAVIIVWGLIVYKIVAKDNTGIEINYLPQTTIKTQNKIEETKYSLLDNYPDPFLAKKKITITKQITKNTAKINAVVPKQQPWPSIKFNGYIFNGNSAKAHISVNNENMILKVNDLILNDYTLSVITSDSIKVRRGNEYKWFHK